MEVWPHIQVKNRKSGEKKRYQLDQERVVIGRDASNYIVLDSRTISRRHAEISKEGNQYYLKDLKSNNGTLLNEKKLKPQEKVLLKPSDLLQIENFDMIFQLPSSSEVEDPYEQTDTDILEIKMVKKLLRAMDRESAPVLEVVEGPQAGERFVLDGKRQEIYIGRDAACEFRIDSEVISRKHARVVKKMEAVTLFDLGSKNGSFVNKERVKEKILHDGDVIHLGTITIGFRNPQELSVELFPPKPPEPVLKTAVKEDTSPEIAAAEAPEKPGGPRATRKRQEKLVQAAAEAAKQEPEPAPESTPAEEGKEEPTLGSSLPEIVMLLIGLVVLVGAIWAILKVL